MNRFSLGVLASRCGDPGDTSLEGPHLEPRVGRDWLKRHPVKSCNWVWHPYKHWEGQKFFATASLLTESALSMEK